MAADHTAEQAAAVWCGEIPPPARDVVDLALPGCSPDPQETVPNNFEEADHGE